MSEHKDFEACLRQKFGMDVSLFEEGFLQRTMEKRLALTQINSYKEYVERLCCDSQEAVVFFHALHIGFSEFFRNPLTFSVLEHLVLPTLFEKQKNDRVREIRVWSAASSSGQEPYSFAMVFSDVAKGLKTDIGCRIFATDICPDELEKAQKGIYRETALNKVPYGRVQRYFVRRGENYEVRPELRMNIEFSVFDLLSEHGDAPPSSVYGNFDFIFCSNVLFYYKPEYQHRILEKLTHSLAKGGYLITGEAEREIVRSHRYNEIVINSGIFQRTGLLAKNGKNSGKTDAI